MAKDLIAVFHASFHPTRGNVVDWSAKLDDGVSLEGVEYAALPSGMHLVGKDIIYFSIPQGTSSNAKGLAVFRRISTAEEGQRGVKLGSLGVLVSSAKPWQHLDALNEIFDSILSSSTLDFSRAQSYFDAHKHDPSTSTEESSGSSDGEDDSNSPLHHTAHLLPLLGPLSITLHKHVHSRRRILIFAKPPVQGSCILAWVAASLLSYEEGIDMLGMVTLNDFDRLANTGRGKGWVACTTDALYLEKPSYYDLLVDLTTLKSPAAAPGTVRKPAFYTTSSGKLEILRWGWSDIKPWTELERLLSLAPLHSHAGCCHPSETHPSSDNDIQHQHSHKQEKKLSGSWTEFWLYRLYEDVCLVCASLFMSSPSSSGNVRLEGDENPLSSNDQDERVPGSFFVRSVGMGIEGRSNVPREIKRARRGSDMSALVNRAATMGTSSPVPPQTPTLPSTPMLEGLMQSDEPDSEAEVRDRQRRTTQAIQQTFYAIGQYHRSALKELVAARLPTQPATTSSEATSSGTVPTKPKPRRRLSLPLPGSSSTSSSKGSTGESSVSSLDRKVDPGTVSLLPKDLLSLSLNPWSSFDGRYVEWLAEDMAFGSELPEAARQKVAGQEREEDRDIGKVKVVMKRNWSGLVGVLVPYG